MMTRNLCILMALAAFLASAAPLALALNINVTSGPYSADKTGITDCRGPFETALKDIVTAGGGTLIVPSGNYLFSNATVVDLKNTTVTILGRGRGVSNLHAYGTGVFYFNNTQNNNQLAISDISFIADVPGVGYAVKVINPSLCAADTHSLTVERVECLPKEGTTGNFDYGFYTTYLQQPVFTDVTFNGSSAAGQFAPGSGFLLAFASNSPTFTSCNSWHVQTGYDLRNTQGTATFRGNGAVNVGTGFSIYFAAAAATRAVEMSGFNTAAPQTAPLTGLEISKARNITIKNYLPGAGDGVNQLILTDCNCSPAASITGCYFQRPPPPKEGEPIPSWTKVWLRGSTNNVTLQYNDFAIFGGDTSPLVVPESGVGTWSNTKYVITTFVH